MIKSIQSFTRKKQLSFSFFGKKTFQLGIETKKKILGFIQKKRIFFSIRCNGMTFSFFHRKRKSISHWKNLIGKFKKESKLQFVKKLSEMLVNHHLQSTASPTTISVEVRVREWRVGAFSTLVDFFFWLAYACVQLFVSEIWTENILRAHIVRVAFCLSVFIFFLFFFSFFFLVLTEM